VSATRHATTTNQTVELDRDLQAFPSTILAVTAKTKPPPEIVSGGGSLKSE
jgi:hypothetical protein